MAAAFTRTLLLTCVVLVTFAVFAETNDKEELSGDKRNLASGAIDQWRLAAGLNGTTCKLRLMKERLLKVLTKTIEEAKLLEYQLEFFDYDVNPLLVNMSYNYRANIWQRTTSRHGRTLLTLAVNYDLLSLTMLGFGVERLNVTLADEPNHCFGELTADDKIRAVRTLLMNDFRPADGNDDVWHTGHALCHQVIQTGFYDYGYIAYQCYEKKAESDQIRRFTEGLENRWVTLLCRLLEIVRAAFVLFGPLVLQYWFYKGDIKSSVPYVVHLDEKYKCHIDAKLANVETSMGAIVRVSRNPVGKGPPRKVPLQKLRKRIRGIKPNPGSENARLKVSLHKLHVVVDHTKLMTQREVPVGLLSFLNREIILCRILTQEPLRSFSLAGCLLGTWKGPFLWKRIRHCSVPPILTLLTWKKVFRLLGKITLFLILIPLPFHIRVLAYHYSEAAEMLDQQAAIDAVNLKGPYVSSFWFGLPWPSAVVVLYGVYAFCMVTLGTIRTCVYRGTQFDDVLQDCFTDLRKISRSAILRMILAHLLLPLEKFGIILGVLVAIPYYIVMLPLVLIIALFYGIPTFYMIGRFMANDRFGLMLFDFRRKEHKKDSEKPTLHADPENPGIDPDSDLDASETDEDEQFQPMTQDKMTLSNGASTCGDMFFLDEISPDTREYPRLPTRRIRRRVLKVAARTQSGLQHCRRIVTLTVGFLCVVLMLDLVLMYAEAVQFFLEVLILTLMGVIANADFALDYFMVFFWTIIYCNTCFKHVYESYAKLTGKIFDFLKGELDAKVSSAMRVPEHFQIHTGFKYFTHQRMQELDFMAHHFQESDSEDEDDHGGHTHTHDEHSRCFPKDILTVSKMGRLYWRVNNLVLFISKKDVPRIPKKLFWKICNELKAPGCPGPLRRSILQAFKQLVYMILFLLFVFIIIMSFDEVANLSDSNQLLLTVVSGFLPFIIHEVLMPKEPEVDLSNYSLQGKMEEILLNYRQAWPAYDIAGKVDPDDRAGSAEECHSNADPCHPQPDTDSKVSTTVELDAESDDPCHGPGGSGSGHVVVDVGHVEVGVPTMVSKPTVSAFSFWDGPVMLRKEHDSNSGDTV